MTEIPGLLRQIYDEKWDFDNKDIQVVPGFTYNQKKTLETIYLYYNSKFESGEIDDEGNKKYFYNINKNPCKVFSKSVDFDTKHININTAEGGFQEKTWYFERDLKFWMKDKQFGRVLNRIFNELPIFGSVVLKIIQGIPYFVDLRNFIVEQSADTLDQSNYKTEIHHYTPEEFRKIGKEMGWENIEKAIEEFREMKDTSHITVYERYGEIEQVDNKGRSTYTQKRVFIADVGVDEFDQYEQTTIPYTGVLLKEDDNVKHPYYEFHAEKIPGRWLGIGVVETLFEPQIRQNEIANLQAKGSVWAALRIFQTRDQGVNRNLLTDVVNGELLNVESEITQIDMSDRNLAFFNEETQKWLTNRDELTFSYDVIQGERLPAGTPLGSARLAAAMAGSHFDQIRENIALKVKELLYKVIIPYFEKEATPEHILRIAGEDLDKVQSLIIKQKATDSLFDFIKNKGKLPTKEHFEITKTAIGERVKRGKEILLTIPKNFYKGLKYAIDIVITGESKDTAVYAATLFAGLQAVTADPTLLTDPTKKKFFFKWLESGGVSPIDLIEIGKPSVEQLVEKIPVKGAGGGVSRPTFPAVMPGITPEARTTL